MNKLLFISMFLVFSVQAEEFWPETMEEEAYQFFTKHCLMEIATLRARISGLSVEDQFEFVEIEFKETFNEFAMTLAEDLEGKSEVAKISTYMEYQGKCRDDMREAFREELLELADELAVQLGKRGYLQ